MTRSAPSVLLGLLVVCGSLAAPSEARAAGFDPAAASTALAQASTAATKCKQDGGPTGAGSVKVTFGPAGAVLSADIEGPPFAGTPVGACIAGIFRGVKVPPFTGAPVAARKTFTIR